jgi:hypothetical protein
MVVAAVAAAAMMNGGLCAAMNTCAHEVCA